jgi:PAS domain-containing protein
VLFRSSLAADFVTTTNNISNLSTTLTTATTDITNLKNIETKLKTSEEKFRQLIEKSPEAHIILDNNQFIDLILLKCSILLI